MEKRRPSTKTLLRVEEWLSEYGFSIYGANIQVSRENGKAYAAAEYPGNRDFTMEECIEIVRLHKAGKIEQGEE